MGTVFSFAFGAPVSEVVVRAVEEELDRIDSVFSTYRADSQIARLADGRDDFGTCSTDVLEVLELCDEAACLTGGVFDAWHSGRFDPTGLVKGWAVARVADLLAAAGSTRHAVNGGGDVLVAADPCREDPWRIGVNGGLRGRLLGAVTAHNLAAATSGNVERPGEIIDPFTGRPAVSVQSATVVGPDIVMADAFATATVAMGRSAFAWLSRLPGYAGLLVGADGVVAETAGWRSLVTTAGPTPPGAS
jgi:thiamine biosynthesis lipoprotein